MRDRTALFQLRESMQSAEMLEVHTHRRKIPGGCLARIEVLMFGAEWYDQRAAGGPIVTNAVDDAESRAFDNVNRLFAMLVLAGVAPSRNLGDQAFGPPCAKSE